MVNKLKRELLLLPSVSSNNHRWRPRTSPRHSAAQTRIQLWEKILSEEYLMFKDIPKIQSLVENAGESSEKFSLISFDLVRITFFKITLTIIIMRTLNDDLKIFPPSDSRCPCRMNELRWLTGARGGFSWCACEAPGSLALTRLNFDFRKTTQTIIYKNTRVGPL